MKSVFRWVCLVVSAADAWKFKWDNIRHWQDNNGDKKLWATINTRKNIDTDWENVDLPADVKALFRFVKGTFPTVRWFEPRCFLASSTIPNIGWGVFLLRPFLPTEDDDIDFVTEFVGKITEEKKWDAKWKPLPDVCKKKECYLAHIPPEKDGDVDRVIDPTDDNGIVRDPIHSELGPFLNSDHKTPNCLFHSWYPEKRSRQQRGPPRLFVRTIGRKMLLPFQELFLNYGYDPCAPPSLPPLPSYPSSSSSSSSSSSVLPISSPLLSSSISSSSSSAPPPSSSSSLPEPLSIDGKEDNELWNQMARLNLSPTTRSTRNPGYHQLSRVLRTLGEFLAYELPAAGFNIYDWISRQEIPGANWLVFELDRDGNFVHCRLLQRHVGPSRRTILLALAGNFVGWSSVNPPITLAHFQTIGDGGGIAAESKAMTNRVVNLQQLTVWAKSMNPLKKPIWVMKCPNVYDWQYWHNEMLLLVYTYE